VQDLHPPQLVSAVQAFCSTTLQLQDLSDLQQQLVSTATGKLCHGQLTASSKRLRLGRLKVQQQLYTALPDGGLDVFAAPDGLILTPQLLVQTTLSDQQLQPNAAPVGPRSGLLSSGVLPASTVSSEAGGLGAQQMQQQAPAGSTAEVGQQQSEDGLFRKFASSMRLEMSAQVGVSQHAVDRLVRCVV